MKLSILKKAIIGLCIASVSAFATQVKNIDEGLVNVSIKNNKANILTFPFIVSEAKIATNNPQTFQIKAKGDSIVIIPTATVPSARADLIVWSKDGYTYLLKIDIKGKDQYWNFTSNRIHRTNFKAMQFETGRIDSDIKKLFKRAILNKNIPGYKKVKVKRKFMTPDLEMQKDYIFDGAKYRVEKWFLKNRTDHAIALDEGNIYTKGILAIAFESRTIPPHKIGTMYLIVNKATINDARGK